MRKHVASRDDYMDFVRAFNVVANDIHEWSMAKGFWEDGEDRNDGELFALFHTELSEAYEAIRTGNQPDDKLPNFSGVEVELADAIIRIMDAAHTRQWRVADALVEKMQYNETRPYKHGKQF